MGYFTAGVLLLLGVVLIAKFGREMKICYPVGGVFVLLGVWWIFNTMYPQHPVVSGWLGWVVKGIAAAALVGLAIYFFVRRKREVDKFKASQEASRKTMYDNYDDFQYEDEQDGEAHKDPK